MMWRLIFGWMLSIGVSAAEVSESRVEYAGVRFRVVRVAPEQLRVMWKDSMGKPLATFERVRQSVGEEGKRLSFIMNAGIYEPGLIPSGIHVEKGIKLRPLNLRDGKGNFFLKPNGVFAVTKSGEVGVWSAIQYQARPEVPRLAIQSGPLLLTDGERHPKFHRGSSSVKHRNGVGLDDKGRVVFAMTDKRQEVNFWDFAGLFLKLGCMDALFLDGDISQMAVNPKGELKSSRFAAMFVVVVE